MGVKRRVGEVGPPQIPVLESCMDIILLAKKEGGFGSEVRSWFGHRV